MKKITLLLFLFLSVFAFAQVIDEDFEAVTFPPTGWTMTTNGVGSSVNPWTRTNNTALTNLASDGAARTIRQTTAVGQERQTWLITPQVLVPTNGQLRFFTRNELAGNQGSTFSVRISTDPDPTNLAAYTTVETWTELTLVAQYDVYEEKLVSLTGNVGNNVYIAFVRSNVQTVPGINGNGDSWLVDDVLLIEQCLNPTDLSATSVLSTSATLNWTDPNGATEWQIEYGPLGFTPGTGTIVTANTNPFPITGLTPATQYSFYVQSVCSVNNSSEQVGPEDFTTQIAPPECGGQFFDSGGPTANYAANTNSTITICPDEDNPNDIVTVTFTAFHVENRWDALYVFQGDTNTAPQIDSGLGLGLGPNGALTGGFWSSVANALIPGPFESSTPGGCLTFQFISDGIIQNAGWVANVTCAPAPTCPRPTALAVTNVTGDSATATWTENAGATTWEYLLLPCGSPEPDETTTGFVSTTTNPLNLTGLTSSTCYTLYVRAVCGPGDSSLWSVGSSFTTTQIPVPLNYSEDFEGIHGWTLSNGTQTNKWVVGTAVSNSPTTSLYVSNDNGVSNNYTNTATSVVHAYRDLQLPPIAGEINVSFDWRNVGENNFDYVRAWLVPATFVPTPGTQITVANSGGQQLGGNFQSNANFTTANFLITATPFQGQVRRLIFEWRNDGIIGTNPAGAIDNVNISLITCPAPTTLAASNLEPTSLTLSWTEIGTATAWHVLTLPCGSPAPTSTTTGWELVTSNSIELNDLDPSTCYAIYVRSACAEDDLSLWTQVLNVNTPQIPAELNFEEDFEGTTAWTLINGNQVNKWVIGTAVSNSPTTSLYISNNNGVSNNYATNSTSVVQAYRDLAIPVDTEEISVSFDWRNDGEINFDYLRVWLVPITYQPTPGVQTTVANSGGQQLGGNFQNVPTFTNANFVLNSTAFDGTTRRLLFEWRNDGIIGTQPPAAVDNINVSIVTCPRPDAFVLNFVDETTATISWNEVGTATEWELILLPVGAPAPTPSTVGDVITTENPYTFTDLDSGTQYVLYVRSLCSDDDIGNWSEPFVFATLISNDNCEDAILVPVNPDTNCAQVVAGTVTGATPSPNPNACGGTADDDVWFQFVAQSTTHVIGLNNITGSTNNLETVVYTGSCNALTQVFCGTNNENTLNNLVIGQTYYIRVYTFTNLPNQTSAFNLCISTILPPISVSQTLYTNQQLVEDVLLNSTCATVSNIIATTGTNFGSTNGIGYFNKNGSSFPFEDGVILTSGNVVSAPGPNTTTQSNGAFTWPGDPQLTALANSTGANGTTQNATILQFDFIPVIPEISFDFIFASEEYGTFQCTFTDVFAFYLSELDASDNIISTVNLAVVPGTTPPVPISVTTIRNNLHNTGCASANPTYFGQYYGAPNGLPNIGSPTNYNGNTVPMVASSAVTPGTKYRIKLAIADYNDSAWDSAVFLNGGSFNIGNLELGDDLLVDAGNALCDGEIITIDSELDADDYEFVWYLGDNIIENENSPSLTITAPGTYTLEATFINSDCVGTGSITVEFFDPIVTDEPNNLTICDGSGFGTFDLTSNTDVVLNNLSSDFSVLYFNTESDAVNNTNPILNPEAYQNISNPETIFVRITSESSDCFVTDSFLLNVEDLTPEFEFNSDTSICEGQELTLLVVPTNFTAQDDVTYTWLFNDEPLTPTSSEIIVSQAGVYEVIVNNSGCESTSSMELFVVPAITFPEMEDVEACDEYALPTISTTNILTNGDFSAGNTGFTTDYNFTPLNPAGGQGLYTVDTNPQAWFNAFAPCTDHTTGDGDMLIVDGSTQNAGEDRVWCQTVTVIPNQNYTISYWVQTIALPNAAVIETRINGVAVGTSTAPSATCEWVEHSYTWNSGDSTTAEICLYDTLTAQDGNDFAIDDISFKLQTGMYYTGPGGTGDALAVGTIITESQQLWLYTSAGPCTAETSFMVTISSATADQLAPVTACDSYELLPLSAENNYYTGPGGTGTMFMAGEVITSTQTLYVYAVSTDNPLCTDESTFEITINETPVIDPIADVVSCDNYTLPALAVGNYYTEPGGLGTMLNAGDQINETITLFVYADNAGCIAVEQSFTITIPVVVADILEPVSACDNYELEPLSAGNTYYTGPNGTGDVLTAGSLVTSTQTIYIQAVSNTTPVCTDESSFVVTITETPVIAPIANVVECDVYVLPNLPVGNYYTRSGATGTMLAAGDEITTSQTIFVYAANGNCIATEQSFTVTIPEVSVETLPDVEICDVYFLPELTTGSYYTSPGGVGIALGAGDEVTASQTIYIYQGVADTDCFAESSFEVSILACQIPRGISPNNDGFNDALDLTNFDVKYISIYNRHGREVYSKSDYTNEWFGQSANGDELPDGTYFYNVERNNGENSTGWIYINREL